MTLTTLTDVRELMRHLPQDRRARPTWHYVAQQLAEAAAGAAHPADATISLRLALMLENVECRQRKPAPLPPPWSVKKLQERAGRTVPSEPSCTIGGVS